MIKFSDDSIYQDLDERNRKAVWDILSVLNNAPLCDARKVLDCAKEILEYNAVWHYPKAESEKENFDELADKVARRLVEQFAQAANKS